MSAHYALYLYEPGVLQKVINEEMALSPELALVETFTNWLIPLTMAFLTVTLADAKNRYLNLILGGVFTLLGIIHLGICPIVHPNSAYIREPVNSPTLDLDCNDCSDSTNHLVCL
jgi:hypothetical protein